MTRRDLSFTYFDHIMVCLRDERLSDSPLVKSIVRTVYCERAKDLIAPDGCWDILIIKHHDKQKVLFTGVTTHPVVSVNVEGDELLCVSFKPGVYIPGMSPKKMRDQGVMLPRTDSRSIAVGCERIEIPTFESADDFVEALSKRDLLVQDELVNSVLFGEPRAASLRSIQRHFIETTGVTLNFHLQIRRVHRAAQLLREGNPAIEVAAETGYSDQPHMVRSLKSLLGQTPTQIYHSSK